jgi:hypothetical protein
LCAVEVSPFIDLEEEAPDFDQEDFADARPSTVDDTPTNPLHTLSAPPVFSFSHVPPPSLHGYDRWPGTQDSQSQSSNANLAPNLFDIWVHVQHFLPPSDHLRMFCIDSAFSLGIICSPLWLTRPWQPHRRRRYGFGSISINRSATTDKPTLLHVFQQLWPFLAPADRHKMQLLHPSILRYAFQRIHATRNSLSVLRAHRLPPTKPQSINQPWTRLFGSALLRFDFVYGDMTRWLSGEYTNRHRNWTNTFHNLQSLPRRGHPRGLPPADFPRAQRITTEGYL